MVALGPGDRIGVSVRVDVIGHVTVPGTGHWVLASRGTWHTDSLLCVHWLVVWVRSRVVLCNLERRLRVVLRVVLYNWEMSPEVVG